MELQDVSELLADESFEPFRLHLSDGSSYDVLRREAVLLAQTKMILGVPSDNAPWERAYDHFAHIALRHINRIEPIRPTRTKKKTS